jgi:hypothetical protein
MRKLGLIHIGTSSWTVNKWTISMNIRAAWIWEVSTAMSWWYIWAEVLTLTYLTSQKSHVGHVRDQDETAQFLMGIKHAKRMSRQWENCECIQQQLSGPWYSTHTSCRGSVGHEKDTTIWWETGQCQQQGELRFSRFRIQTLHRADMEGTSGKMNPGVVVRV